jgi:hypothetical protein
MLTPEQIIERLEEIERDLADRQIPLGDAAEAWTRAKRDKEKAWADAYMKAEGAITTRKAAAIQASESIGIEAEARYVGLSKACGVMETRSMIGMALLKAHGRIEGPSPSGRTYGEQRAA